LNAKSKTFKCFQTKRRHNFDEKRSCGLPAPTSQTGALI